MPESMQIRLFPNERWNTRNVWKPKRNFDRDRTELRKRMTDDGRWTQQLYVSAIGWLWASWIQCNRGASRQPNGDHRNHNHNHLHTLTREREQAIERKKGQAEGREDKPIIYPTDENAWPATSRKKSEALTIVRMKREERRLRRIKRWE